MVKNGFQNFSTAIVRFVFEETRIKGCKVKSCAHVCKVRQGMHWKIAKHL